jgi:hypothetical protein
MSKNNLRHILRISYIIIKPVVNPLLLSGEERMGALRQLVAGPKVNGDALSRSRWHNRVRARRPSLRLGAIASISDQFRSAASCRPHPLPVPRLIRSVPDGPLLLKMARGVLADPPGERVRYWAASEHTTQ